MISLPSDLSTEDNRKYYLKSFVQINDFQTKSKRFVYPSEINDSFWMVYTENTGQPKTLRVKTFNIDSTFPKIGWYPYKEDSIFFSKRNVRQFKKGLTTEWTDFCFLKTHYILSLPKVSPLHSFLFSTDFNFPLWEMNNLFFKSSDISMEEKIKSVENGKTFSVPLSREICISQGMTSNNPQFFFRTTLCGDWNNGKILVHDYLFLQELIDFFQPKGIICSPN